MQPVRQIIEHVGEPTKYHGNCASGRDGIQRPDALEAVSEAITELESMQTVNLTGDAGHDKLLPDAGADAEPAPVLEFD